MSSASQSPPILRMVTMVTLLWITFAFMTGSAHAQCDVPLEVQQGSVAPNVLIIMDSSGSMNHIIEHGDYDASVAWSGPFARNTTYNVDGPAMRTPQSFNAAWDSLAPPALLTGSDMGNASRYWGNYLNWIFYHATDEQRAALPQTTRIIVGKAAVSALMQQASGLRYGLMTFNGDTGGLLRSAVGEDVTTVTTQVNEINAGGMTPSAETLLDALILFRDNTSWIEYDCQQSFIIFVSDGYPTNDLDIPAWIGDQDGDGREPGDCASIGAIDGTNCSDYLDDVAYYMANNDLRSDLDGDQHVYTYTIGFGIDAPLLYDTAENGQGLYQTAFNFQSLVQSLGNVVGDIVNRISAGAAVAVVSTEQSGNNTLFRGKFMPGLWRGWFEAHELPFDASNAARWEAGEILRSRSADSRTIYTGIDNNLVHFKTSNVDDIDDFMTPPPDSLGTAEDLIDYIRGREISPMRDRDGWKLGDLVHSTPVVVGRPAYFYLDPAYQQFLITHESREPVAYIGGNDGMLHAFRASDGHEMWAYIPQAVLPKLNQLADPDYCHQAYVDLSPKAFDVKLNGVWKTVLIGGERTGGNSWFALDVTDPYSPELMWEKSVPETISSFSEPALVHAEEFGSLLWVGSGPDPAGKSRYAVIWMETGNLMWWDSYPDIAADANLASAPTAVDLDFDGYEDVLYQGTMDGDLWRWDLTGSTIVGSKLFDGDQPVTGRPTLATDVDGSVLVYFGTGEYLDMNDLLDVTQQSFYCVRDQPGANYVVTRADLLNQTSSPTLVEGGPGWYVDLVQRPGERITEPAIIIDGVVYATSFAPSQEVCSAGGISWLYAMDYRNGRSARGNPESEADRVTDVGRGIASRPVVNLAEGTLIVQTSDARLNVLALATRPPRIQVRSWRETYPNSVTNDIQTQDPQTP